MRTCPNCLRNISVDRGFCTHCGSGVGDLLAETEPIPEAQSDSDVEGRFLPGTVLADRYRIIALLGRGGMGEVYRATDLKLRQTVALKFLPEPLAQHSLALNGLYNEVRLARQISHSNVCRVYDIAEAGGLQFMVMEYVDGENLHSLLRRIGRVPTEKATGLARRLCAGLAAAHDRGVIHRDIKPANVMLDSDGNVRITDFGLAVLRNRLSQQSGSGTPIYMAPEQLAGAPATIQSDIYSLGLVLYELLGGRNPFERTPKNDLLRMKQEFQPASLSFGPDVPPQAQLGIAHCLAADPRDRPASAAALSLELSTGDPLAATLAAGEIPAPELVARAGAKEGLRVRVAVLCLAGLLAALVAFVAVGPKISILSRVPLESSAALQKLARDRLSGLGLEYPARHRVTRFGYDLAAVQRHFDPGALYFLYRTSPHPMVPHGLTTVVTSDDPPANLPGMVTTRWDGTGRLLHLQALPTDSPPAGLSASELWARLLMAAGLELAHLRPIESRWIRAPVWDARASWEGVYPDRAGTAIRVEAAGWHGRPVYFEVVPDQQNGAGTPSAVISAREVAMMLTAFFVVFAISAILAWRNVRLGRGDRRGAFRIAVFLFAAMFSGWLLNASHTGDLTESFLVFTGISWAGFMSGGFWTIYMAFEPYVRRRWPRALISWNRILSGNFKDPVVGGHILIGTAAGAAMATMTTAGLWLAGADGLRLASLGMLSGASGTFSNLLGQMADGIARGLSLLFFVFFCKVFFRSEWVAVLLTAVLTIVFEPWSPLRPAAIFAIALPLALGYVYLLLRLGLLAVTVAIFTSVVLIELPMPPDLSAPGGAASILMLCGLAALGFFGFRSTLAGRPLMRLDV